MPYSETIARAHGLEGFKKIEVDVSGNTIRTISQQEPINGQDLKLSIDIELQKIAMDALQGKKGALEARGNPRLPNNARLGPCRRA